MKRPLFHRCIGCGAYIYEDDKYEVDDYGDFLCDECIKARDFAEQEEDMPEIKNIPDYASEYPYIVAHEIEGELWFWGAYDDSDRANEVAEKIGGVVKEVEK